MNMARDDRVAVYMDGSNLYHSLRSLANRADLDFLKFAIKLADGRRLRRVYYYNAPVDQTREPNRYQEQQRFFQALRRVDYLELQSWKINLPPCIGRTVAPYE